jgi:hypothetical protein
MWPPLDQVFRQSCTHAGKEDAKKAKVWGKYGKLIVQTAKAGGPNPESNLRLGEVRVGESVGHLVVHITPS